MHFSFLLGPGGSIIDNACFFSTSERIGGPTERKDLMLYNEMCRHRWCFRSFRFHPNRDAAVLMDYGLPLSDSPGSCVPAT
jgi:hypothetical protein